MAQFCSKARAGSCTPLMDGCLPTTCIHSVTEIGNRERLSDNRYVSRCFWVHAEGSADITMAQSQGRRDLSCCQRKDKSNEGILYGDCTGIVNRWSARTQCQREHNNTAMGRNGSYVAGVAAGRSGTFRIKWCTSVNIVWHV